MFCICISTTFFKTIHFTMISVLSLFQILFGYQVTKHFLKPNHLHCCYWCSKPWASSLIFVTEMKQCWKVWPSSWGRNLVAGSIKFRISAHLHTKLYLLFFLTSFRIPILPEDPSPWNIKMVSVLWKVILYCSHIWSLYDTA